MASHWEDCDTVAQEMWANVGRVPMHAKTDFRTDTANASGLVNMYLLSVRNSNDLSICMVTLRLLLITFQNQNSIIPI